MFVTCGHCNGSGKIPKVSRFRDEENDTDITLLGDTPCKSCNGMGLAKVMVSESSPFVSHKTFPVIQIA